MTTGHSCRVFKHRVQPVDLRQVRIFRTSGPSITAGWHALVRMSDGREIRQYVDTVTTPDEQSVLIKLKTANPRFHYIFICGIVNGFEVLPEHVWGKVDPKTHKDNPPTRTGAYKLDRVIPD